MITEGQSQARSSAALGVLILGGEAAGSFGTLMRC